jgi:hypothetical protein
LTLKTVLIAIAAVTALIGAALMAVPSAQEGLQLCLDLPGAWASKGSLTLTSASSLVKSGTKSGHSTDEER